MVTASSSARDPEGLNRMNVLITGGGGFLGWLLAGELLRRGRLVGPGGEEEIGEIRLLDQGFARPLNDPRVVAVTGDVGDRERVFAAVGNGADSATAIFHLASMVSGECELRFEDALRVNLDGGRHLFEAARAVPGRSRLVFASSIACFGGDEVAFPFSDRSKLLPQTTYGMTKAICELMINDYSRKGFFDGRSARLPTVIIRPGRPNAAASSWASGMFREPLAGEPCELPVRVDQPHPMTGYRTVIDSLIRLFELPAERLGCDRAVGLPAHRVTPRDAEHALRQVAEESSRRLGPIVATPDPRIQQIVDGWATEIDGTRAIGLGLPQPPPLIEIIRHYLSDFGTG